jgi:ribosomal protein L32
MAQPKKHSSPRKTGLRRSHLLLKLARRVNGKSPVKVRTTKNETGKVKTAATVKKATKKPAAAKK